MVKPVRPAAALHLPTLQDAGRQSGSGDAQAYGGQERHPVRELRRRIPLWGHTEELFASPETQQCVRELQKQSAFVLDSENKERVLVGDVISTVALAGQLCQEFNVT
jgi:hypothetical protein